MKKNNNNNNTNNNELFTNLYKFGASANIISLLVLLYHGIHSVYTHSPIHITLIIFTIIKVIGQGIEIPYYWIKTDAKEALYNKISVVGLYGIILSIYCYGYFFQ